MPPHPHNGWRCYDTANMVPEFVLGVVIAVLSWLVTR